MTMQFWAFFDSKEHSNLRFMVNTLDRAFGEDAEYGERVFEYIKRQYLWVDLENGTYKIVKKIPRGNNWEINILFDDDVEKMKRIVRKAGFECLNKFKDVYTFRKAGKAINND